MSAEVSGGIHTFTFDPAVCRLSAVKKAAYRFTEQFSVTVEIEENRIVATLRELGRTPSRRCDPRRFPNEALDQELRELVAEETRPVRDILLAQAFSGLSLIDSVGETADWRGDPLGVAGKPQQPG